MFVEKWRKPIIIPIHRIATLATGPEHDLDLDYVYQNIFCSK